MKPIELLTDARAREVPWPLIVEALRELTSDASVDDQGRPWIEVAAHLSGYTTNQLRIGQRTFASIRSFIDAHGLPMHGLQWSMSNLEVITRIAKANPESAKIILSSSNQKTLRELRTYYDQVREEAGSNISAMSAGHQSAKLFTKNLFKILSTGETVRQVLRLSQNTPLGLLKVWPGRYPYVHPDFHVDFSNNGTLQIAAFEGLRFYGDVTSQVATQAALKAAVEATFFSMYYWCAPSWVPTADLRILRDKLGLYNVGILSIGETEMESVIHPLGSSIHDRQHIILDDSAIRYRLRVGMFNNI